MNDQVLTRPRPRTFPFSTQLGNLMASLFSRRMRQLEYGTLDLHFANRQREQIVGARPGPKAALEVHRASRLVARIAARGDLGFAEGYLAGDWQTDDLFALLHLLALNEPALVPKPGGLLAPLARLRHRARRNDRRGSKRNIEAHYDLGNDFYALWLDETWSYSSALFTSPDQALADAQRGKYALHLDALDAQPGDHLLEIGCGWGGLAIEAARRGLHVTGITLSPAQLAVARERVASAGFSDRVELRLMDYRDLDGQFDHVVSIEMFEAVGEAYWPVYFDTLKRVLKPGGRASLQVITIDEEMFEVYRRESDFIQQYVFPGGMLPSKTALLQQSRDVGLSANLTHAFGYDYARTLRHWSDQVVVQERAIREQGYGDRFLRLWQYYLAYCHAGFVTNRIDVVQTTLRHQL